MSEKGVLDSKRLGSGHLGCFHFPLFFPLSFLLIIRGGEDWMAAKHRYRRVQLRKRHTDIANTESELNDMGRMMRVSVMSVMCR